MINAKILTSRYAEGLDVLYRTNLIHIGSVILTRHISLFLLPQRLASITALEFVWDLGLFPVSSKARKDDTKGWPACSSLVATIASVFPSLENLYISIQTNSYMANAFSDNVEGYERKLLIPIDEMVRKIGPKLRDCQIAPPRSLHRALMYRAESLSARTDSRGYGALRFRRFWRPITVGQKEQPGKDLLGSARGGRYTSQLRTHDDHFPRRLAWLVRKLKHEYLQTRFLSFQW